MKWIGLTGGIASGKTTVSNILRGLRYDVVDADELARLVVAKNTRGLAAVVQKFGNDILDKNKALDRSRVAQLVFGNPTALSQLESILHPLVRDLAEKERKRLEKAGTTLAFYDVPLLFEKNMQTQFDSVLVVACEERTQKARLKQRSKLTDAEINNRLKAQIPIEKKKTLSPYVIWNEGSEADLKAAVEEILPKLIA